MTTTFLYTLSDPETGKVRYIGKSDNPFKRFARHLHKEGGCHKSNWVLELRSRGLKPTMELLDEVPYSQWEFWEREYIRVFRAIGFSLVNITDGGDGNGGYKYTEEVRAKMSASHTGVKLSEAHLAARRAGRLGMKYKPRSIASRQKHSQIMKSLWASPEKSACMRAAQSARKKV